MCPLAASTSLRFRGCRFQEFLPQYLEPQRGGSFVSVVDGTSMGTHSGAALYTVGQGAKVPHATYIIRERGKGVLRRKDRLPWIC